MEVNAVQQVLIRSALYRLLMDAGGQVTLFTDDLESVKDFKLTLKPLENPERLVSSIITPEYYDELIKRASQPWTKA